MITVRAFKRQLYSKESSATVNFEGDPKQLDRLLGKLEMASFFSQGLKDDLNFAQITQVRKQLQSMNGGGA